MAIGKMAGLVSRFNSIKYYTQDTQTKLERWNLLISDLEDAFEIPVDDKQAMKEFKENNEFLYSIYLDIIDEKESAEDDLSIHHIY